MTLVSVLLVLWAVLTTILVLLLIYRSTLVIHEDDQLFLNESESYLAKEQEDVIRKIDRLTPLVRGFGAASGLLILAIAGLEVYARIMIS
jgi:hypothetical protein